MTEDAKSVVNASFEEVEAGEVTNVALPKSNSQTVIEAIINETDRDLAAGGNNFDGLKAHGRGGQHLAELKTHLAHGEFDRVVEERLGIKRAWRAKLMKVGRLWPDIEIAIEWAKVHGRFTRSGYSVDGALALLKAWQHREDPDYQARQPKINEQRAKAKQNVCYSYVSNVIEFVRYLKLFIRSLLIHLAAARQRIVSVESELATARRRIAFLESEIERLTGTAPAEAPCRDQPMLEHAK